MRWLYAIVGLAVASALSGALVLQIPAFDVWLYGQLARRTVSAPVLVLAQPRDLSVLLCGTGSPLPDVRRAGPCTLVAAGSHLFLIDAGLDSARNLLLWRVPLDRIDAILLTHFHSDHIAELGEVRLQTWVAGRRQPLAVYGPPGVDRVVAGFNEAYALDAGYRTAHHGAAMLPPDAVSLVASPLVVPSHGLGIVLSRGGLTITAFRVHHEPATPAFGYRFDFHGRSIVVSGDTAPTDNLTNAARRADVLVHEALSPALVGLLRDAAQAAGRTRPAKIFHDIPAYHTSPLDAAGIANRAQVRLLVFTHLLPPLPGTFAEIAFLRGVGGVRPAGVIMGHDGLLVRLPGDSRAIDQSNVN